MYKIVICDDEGKTTIIPFSRQEYSIGRKEGNAVRLTDRNVSRRHAILSKEEDSFFIEDLGSTNGVRVDSDEIGKERREVQIEERVLLGDYRISISEKEYPNVQYGKQVDPRVDKSVGKVTSHARLVMVVGPTCGMELSLSDELYIVGRGDRANMFVDDPSISRAHARLEGADDHWVVSDLDSSNGLYVNGNKRDDYLLRAGDVVEFGNTHFRYVAPGEPYDYEAANLEKFQKEDNSRSRTILISAIVALLLLMVTTLVLLKSFKPEESTVSESSLRLEQYNALIARGDAEMKLRNWEKAARLFAEAQGAKSGTVEATERKREAMMELEAMTSVEAARAAMAEEDWSRAVNEFSKVHEKSSYFDASLVARAAEKLCEELLYTAEFMISSGDKEAQTVLDAIGDIPHVPEACVKRRDRLESLIPIPTDSDSAGDIPGGIIPAVGI